MKKIIVGLMLMSAFSAFAQVHVRGYTRANGTYVAPYERTAPNGTLSDNYSTQGNVNPYTGRAGTVPDTAANYEYQQAQQRQQMAQLQAQLQAQQQEQLQQQQRQLQQMQLQQRQQMQQMTPGQLNPACGLFCN